jgi:hypothetical protein
LPLIQKFAEDGTLLEALLVHYSFTPVGIAEPASLLLVIAALVLAWIRAGHSNTVRISPHVARS